jgi:hypothetical protein
MRTCVWMISKELWVKDFSLRSCLCVRVHDPGHKYCSSCWMFFHRTDGWVSRLYELVSETKGSVCMSVPSHPHTQTHTHTHTHHKWSCSPQYRTSCAGIRKFNKELSCHTLHTVMDSPTVSTMACESSCVLWDCCKMGRTYYTCYT